MNTTLKIFLSLMILNLSVGLAQDTQQIQLTPQVARLVVTDLIEGDSAKEQLKILAKKADLLVEQLSLKDSIITKKDNVILNYETIIGKRSEQLTISQDLSKQLQKDLKKQKARTRLFQYSSGALIVAAVVLGSL